MDTKKLRQKILDLAIRGKLVPQDPNDEPASVLLERIRAEKKRLIAEGKIKRPKKSKASSVESHYQNFTPPFEIPDSWEWVSLGDYLINRDGERIPVSLNIRSKQTNKIYDYYGAAGVIDKVDSFLFNERLLLIGEDGANLISRAKDNAFFADGKYWVNNHAHILDATNKSLLDFVALYINAIALDNYVTGSAQPKLSQDSLNRIQVPIPPFAEQVRILNSVQSYRGIVNYTNQEKQAINEAITLIKSKILDLAMQGKLVPQDPADEPAADMLLRINPKAKIITDNPHYPRWVSTQLGEVCDFERGITFPSVAKEHTKTINNIACLRTANIHDEVDLTSLWFIDKSFLRGNSNKLIRLGDIIMSTANSRELVGRSVIIKTCEEEMTFGGFVTAIRTSVLSPAFLQLFLKYKTMRGDFSKIATQTTNIANLNTKILSGVYISFPCLMEQKRIVAKIEQLYQILDEIEASLQS